MNRIMIMFAGGLLMLALAVPGHGADHVKIGVLSMKRLQEKSQRFLKIKVALQKKFEELQRKLDEEKNRIMKMEEELRKQSMMLSLDAKEDRQKELERMRRHYKYSYEEYTQEMKDAEMERTRKVGKDIEAVVKKLADSEGYTVILEAGMVGLIYFNDAIDITDQVVQLYDAEAP